MSSANFPRLSVGRSSGRVPKDGDAGGGPGAVVVRRAAGVDRQAVRHPQPNPQTATGRRHGRRRRQRNGLQASEGQK